MDRNVISLSTINRSTVALRKESVDRNIHAASNNIKSHVALRKESVDRNMTGKKKQNMIMRSLSARRAWIEIQRTLHDSPASKVALRKESVDRNTLSPVSAPSATPSLSARRAWIEILVLFCCFIIFLQSLSARRAWIEILESKQIDPSVMVALRKESVDRNMPSHWIMSRTCVALRKESVDRNNPQQWHLPKHPRRSPQGERG